MAKLKLTLLVLFVCIAAGAQTVTEKSLAGTWKLSTASMHGMLINFETGKASPTAGNEGNFTADDIKRIENGIKGEHPFPLSVTFKDGGVIEAVTGQATEKSTYSLVNKNGATFINDNGDEYEARIAGKLLTFIYIDTQDNSTIEISFKKQS
jgi:hypothetical protein